jgi:hypothetical protein
MRYSTQRLCAAFAASFLLSISPQRVHAEQLQMLPPTLPGSSTVCPTGNSLLFYSGVGGTDSNGAISAINCMSAAPNVNPSNGDLWLGSSTFGGNVWGTWVGNTWVPNSGVSNGAPEIGPALHLSSSAGTNTDDFYFQRNDIAWDQSVLRLVMGDNATSPFSPAPNGAAIGDAFQIGALDANSAAWTPRFTFTSNGLLGIGTTAPQYNLDVNGTANVTGSITLGGNILSDTGGNAINGNGAPSGVMALLPSAASFEASQGGLWIDGSGVITNKNGKQVASSMFGIFTSEGSGSWNSLTQAGDTILLSYSRGGIDSPTQNGVVIAPWSAYNHGLRMDPNGNVGIDTAFPQATLDVNGTANFSGNITATNTNASMSFGDYGPWGGVNVNRQWMGICTSSSCGGETGGPANGQFMHISGATNSSYGATTRVLGLFDTVIIPNGSLGVGGWSNPKGTLDVENSTGNATFCLNGQCVSSLSPGALVGVPGPAGPQGPAGTTLSCGTNEILIGTGSAATCTSNLTASSTGDINANSINFANTWINNDSVNLNNQAVLNTSGLALNSAPNGSNTISLRASDGSASFGGSVWAGGGNISLNSNGTTSFAGGTVTIGMNSSGGLTSGVFWAGSGKASIDGNGNAAFASGASGCNASGCTPWNANSDRRLKKDIKPLTDALDVVEKLQGVRYNWRAPEDREVGKDMPLPLDKPQIGFIAQDVEKLVPQAVIIDEKTGIYKLDLVKMMPLLVEGMKEQQNAFKEQQAEIAFPEAGSF